MSFTLLRFFVEPKWLLGNILETPVEKLAASGTKPKFARAKQNLSIKCLTCRYMSVCRGGCMKNQLSACEHDFSKETYFYESYKRFFVYEMPKFIQIAARINSEILNHLLSGITKLWNNNIFIVFLSDNRHGRHFM